MNILACFAVMIHLHVACSKGSDWPNSVLNDLAGHYPYRQCKLTNVMLIPEDDKGIFYTKNDVQISKCQYASEIWQFGTNTELEYSNCDVIFDIGHVVLIFYRFGSSNYYHLHWDTAIPLYKLLNYENKEGDDQAIAVLPSVETVRLKEIEWKTDAFSGKFADKYWNQVTRATTGKHTYLPLDNALLQKKETICFKEVYFGTTSWKRTEVDLIQNFIRYVSAQVDVPSTPPLTRDRIGIISRKRRRRILNEDKLLEAIQDLAPAELILYDNLTYKQQVEIMQKYTVVAGMNGAGLMNCIFLPPTSTCVQLVPYGAAGYLNYNDYGTFLKARGPYAEWHNTHEEMNTANSGPHSSDTEINIPEFVEVIKEALHLSHRAREQATEILENKKETHVEL